jgi:hypothetical protein
MISIAGFYFARANESRGRFIFFVLLLLIHIGAAVATYSYTQSFGGDALIYYYDNLQIYGRATGLSTVFLVNFVQTLKTYIGGSFFDYFLLFQSMGFWGLLFMIRAFDDIHQELGQPTFKGVYLLLFLPGLHYWTSAIGKDAPVFLSVAMCTWAAFRLQTRYLVFGAGVVIVLLIRPHIALMALIAFALTLLLGRNISLLTRAGLMAVVLAGIGSVATLVEGTVGGLNLSSTDSMTELLESRSQVSEESGADLSIVEGSFPVKLFSLLFRPFFIDANGALGYIASLENVVLLTIVLTLIRRFRTAFAVARAAAFARFALFFFIMITGLLALFNYNVGLGLRQKMMMMPALLVFFVAVMAVRHLRKEMASGPSAADHGGAPVAGQGYRRA